MSDERTSYLLDVTANFLETHQAWVESDTPYITEDFEARADELAEVFSQGTMPGGLRKLETIVTGDFSPSWDEWRERAGRTGDPNEMPNQRFWKAVEGIQNAVTAAKSPPPVTVESIPDLVAQKVSDRQICLIYGWLDPSGAPDFQKLREEKAEPGKHTKNWVSPIEKQRQQAEQRQKQIAADIAARRARKIKHATEPSKESTEELLRQGLSASQIASMRKTTVSKVFEEADKLGIPRPPINYESPHARRGTHDPEIPEAAARAFDARGRDKVAKDTTESKGRGRSRKTAAQQLEDDLAAAAALDDDEPLPDPADPEGESDDDADIEEGDDATAGFPGAMTLEQEIISYHQQGLAPAEVAKAVSSPGAKVTAAKVRGIVKRWEDDPASIGVPAGS
ncbi:MAG TPA: hypothetical protein VG125_13645 [Pirellulales bacterium]|nr:hypothetical protein [Pirellulales bacterium]